MLHSRIRESLTGLCYSTLNTINAMKSFLKHVYSKIQNSKSSYKRHDNHYRRENSIEIEREIGEKNINNNEINNAEFQILSLLENYPNVKIAVDIGSGTGWLSAAVSKITDKVIAIEPSVSTINIAKELYPPTTYPNIEWNVGFSEEVLPGLLIPKPAIFITGCVLTHLRDVDVEKICKEINSIAPKHSILSLAERWADVDDSHNYMWHVRSKAWWQKRFPGWQLSFHGPLIQGENYHTGIHGVKL